MAIPVPDFIASTRTPLFGADVTFTSNPYTTGSPTSWLWETSDGQTDTVENPDFAFGYGMHSVTLTATNADGSDSVTKNDYIFVGAFGTCTVSATTDEVSNGNRIVLTGEFATLAGSPVDPTTVIVTVETPDGVDTDYIPVSDETGTWTLDYLIPDTAPSGKAWFRFRGTGACTAAAESYFTIARSRVLT